MTTFLKSKSSRILILGILLLTAFACLSSGESNPPSDQPVSEAFKQYWYQGKAELTRYKLQQARYGELHEGDAVLIFVTEDFLKDRQVKYEYGPRNEENILPVFKLNATKKFYTGIYPYSIMNSTFTPVDHDNAAVLKTNLSAQEWCGHVFMQLNRTANGFDGTMFSYFQSEGDQRFSMENAILEDEIWAKIRINPNNLPLGDIRLIPAQEHLRMRHQKISIEAATASLKQVDGEERGGSPVSVYSIAYKDIERKLTIRFDSQFPHTIYSWEVATVSGFGSGAKPLVTRAERTHSIMSPYWRQHSVADSSLRKQLGL